MSLTLINDMMNINRDDSEILAKQRSSASPSSLSSADMAPSTNVGQHECGPESEVADDYGWLAC